MSAMCWISFFVSEVFPDPLKNQRRQDVSWKRAYSPYSPYSQYPEG